MNSKSLIMPALLMTLCVLSTAFAEEAREGGVLTSNIEELYSLPMLPLWLCSLALLTLIFERFNALKASKVLDSSLAETLTKLAGEQKMEDAETASSKSDTMVGKAWSKGLHEFLLGGVDLEEALTNATALAFKPLSRNLQGITTISVISPLLGLLGTVIGMVMVFDQISVSLDPDKQLMAKGIMTALFTTIFGIMIAVPGIVCGRYFDSCIRRYAEFAEASIDEIRYAYLHAEAQSKQPDGGNEEKGPEKKEGDAKNES
ncbi:MAG: MotA/TolQ/ExbB proton channel family protein [Planctomycetota bacterium]|nr:MotA/TolQ/ExbB proton channel family protein [Planctomycetota bacterium]MDA1142927.1 MotA/TolQ/ExbB proton channel family protein [Planctomycetota bacterium]